MTTQRVHRMPIILTVLVVAASLPAPAGSALHDLSLLGVGHLLLDADGGIQGTHLSGLLDARAGSLSDIAVRGAHDTLVPLFDSVSIAGFTARGPAQTVGDAAVHLSGSNAVLHAADASATPLLVRAVDATTITYRLAPGVSALPTAHPGVVMLHDTAGAAVAQLVLVPATASGVPSGALTATADTVEARLAAAEAIALRTVSAHAASAPAHLDAVVGLAASGLLAHEAVADFAGTLQHVGTDYADGLSAETRLVAARALQTTLSRASASAAANAVAFDLDYEVLAVRSADEVAVYLGTTLVPPAASAAAFASEAARGHAASFATVADGRALVLAAAPAAANQVFTVANVAASGGNPPQLLGAALAQGVGAAGGAFVVTGPLVGGASFAATDATGQALVLGRHVSAAASHHGGTFAVRHITDLSSRTLLLDAVTVPAASGVDVAQPAADVVSFQAEGALMVLHDAPAGASMLALERAADALPAQPYLFDLAAGIQPVLESSQVARLDAAGHTVGWLVAVAGPEPTSWARLAGAGGAGSVLSADLGEEARVLLLSSGASAALPASVAHAIASRSLGASAAFALVGQDIGSVVSSHLGADAARLAARHAEIGALDLVYRASAAGAGATSFVALLDGAVPAQRASDVLVLVDGGEAVRLASASAVLSALHPAYHVSTGADLTTVVVNAASQARAPAGAQITILSALVSSAQAHARDDLFGSFEMLPGGAAVGHYVQARVDGAGGVVHDYTVTAPHGPAVVFEAIHVAGDGFATPGASGTHRVTFAASDATVTLTDQTSAVLVVAAEAARSVTFVPSSGVEVQRLAPGLVTLTGPNGLEGALLLGDVTGAASGRGELVLRLPPGADPQTAVRGLDPINVAALLAPGDQVLFRAFSGIETELDDGAKRMLLDALAAGDLGGQVIVQRASSTAGLVQGARGGAAALDATTSFHSGLDIVTAATAERVTVTLSSALERGRTIVLMVDGGTVPGLGKGAAEILFDGAPMAQASSYADVLDPLDDGGVAEYYVLTSTVSGASQVLVSVPSFSVHTVTLQEAEEEPRDLFLWVSLGLGLVVVAQGVMLLRLRRRPY